jgi:NHLM bacteriocin system ABC transporter ATP-binding protein
MIDSSRFVTGNQPIVLGSDTPPAVLASGSAVVFAIDRETGERIHLFSLEAGEPLLPLSYAESASWQIVVVPLEMSCLQPIGSLQDAAGIFALENWLAKIGEALALFRPVGPAQILRARQSLILGHGKRVAVEEGLTLVRMQLGDGLLTGVPVRAGATMVLVPGFWLEANTPGADAEWEIYDGSMSGAASALEPTLDVAVQGLFDALGQVKLRREQEDRRRLTTRLEMNTRVAEDALKRLAGTSGAPGASSELGPPGSDPLFQAVRTIGDFLGMAVRSAPETGHETDSLRAIVNASGIRSRRVALSKNWWRADVGPLLAFRGDGSPVALLPSKEGWLGKTRYRMVDGASQRETPVNARTAPELMESAVMLYRPLPENLSTKSLLLDGFRSQRSDLGTILIAGIGAAILALAIPQGAALLIGDAIPDSDSRMLWQVALGMIAAALGSALFLFTQAIATLRAQTVAFNALESGVWDYLLKLGPVFFRGFTAGQLRMRADAITRIHQMLTTDVLRSLFAGATSFLFVILMLWYSPGLALIALLAGAVMISASWIGGHALYRVQEQWQEAEELLSGLVLQAINAVSKLRVAGAANRAFSYWAGEYSRKQKLALTIQTIRDRVQIVNIAAPGAATAFGFFYLLSNPLPLGSFWACMTAMGGFLAALASASSASTRVVLVANLWRRVRPILSARPEADSLKTHPGRLLGAVTVENLTFRYRDNGPLILDGISIRAKPGQCIALTGPSGAGKSTLLNLLLKFELPASGAIYLDGHELSSLDIAAVRRQIGVVTQDGRLMAGSLYENICASGVNTLDEAWDAARAAGFAGDIEAMPMGMHTMVSENGGNLSGGQRQRLLIARALVQKPALLLFDEATSALDNRNQAIVTESLTQLRATRILIAHRLSTIRSADWIYVIDKGKVQQQGTYTELMSQPGLFARLASRQRI